MAGPAAKNLKKTAAVASQADTAPVAGFLAAIGEEVRRNRAKRGMTRRQLAQASETSERYLAQIESGAGNPSVSVLRAIARALDLAPAALLPDSSARPAAFGHVLDLLAQVPEGELPALVKDIEARLARAEHAGPRSPRRAGRSARRRQIDAGADAGAASRLAVRGTRSSRRTRLRRQHSRFDGNGRHRHVPPA